MNTQSGHIISSADGAAPNSSHLTLAEIRGFVSARRSQGSEWEMPDHLTECPLCLEVFDVLLSGDDKIPRSALWRIRNQVKLPKKGLFSGAVLLKAALFLFLLGSFVFWMKRQQAPVMMEVAQGSVSYSDSSHPLPPGKALPPSRLLRSTALTRIRCEDGSDLTVVPGTEFELPSRFSGETVALQEGEIDFAVTHQAGSRQFRVKTPLGEVVVVGTRFRVTCRTEGITVFKNTVDPAISDGTELIIPVGQAQILKSVWVRVTEGRVRVRNAHEEVLVDAGYTARLRQNQPLIDITQE